MSKFAIKPLYAKQTNTQREGNSARLVDFVGQFMAIVIFSIILGTILLRNPALLQARQAHLAQDLTTSMTARVANLILETVCTIAGGFVAAHLAREAPLKNAAVMGLLALATTLFHDRYSIRIMPVWYSLLSLLLLIPLALLGGYWRAATRKPETHHEAAPPADSQPPIPAPF